MWQFTEPISALLCGNVQNLRKVIAEKVYPNMGIRESDVFISDGAQCDIARLQVHTETLP
jgi:hypothetical protein